MQKLKTDFLDSYQENNSEDSPRTSDSLSKSDKSDVLPLNEIEIDISKRKDFISNSIIYDENEYNSKTDFLESYNKNINDNNIGNNKDTNISQYFKFKIRVSLILCIIYLMLFLMNIPRCAIKTGEEKNINTFIKSNKTEDLNILINNFQFSFSQFEKSNKEISGFLLEFRVNKKYLIRWTIGFIYFIIRNICFIYNGTQKNNEKSIFKNRIDSIQKLSCLLFPLLLFFYDKKSNIFSYVKIKNEYMDFKMVNYFVMVEKNSSINDYIEAIIPTIFYFLISLFYNGIEQNFIVFIKNSKKETKLV